MIQRTDPRESDSVKEKLITPSTHDGLTNTFDTTRQSTRRQSTGQRQSCCRRCCCCNTVCAAIWLCICVTLGSILFYSTFLEDGIHNFAVSQTTLAEGSERADMWINGQLPLKYTFYVFNLTNRDDFLQGSRPILDEVGPFVYSVLETKQEARYEGGGTFIYFRSMPIFKFEPELSVKGGEDLVVFTLNIPLVNSGDIARGILLETGLKIIRELHQFDSIEALTIKQLLWGYKSKVITWAQRMMIKIPYPYDYFALLAGRNNTLQPLTSVNSGVADVHQTSQVLSFAGPGPQTGCNAVRGSEGSGFGPEIQKSDVLFIYNGQFCRSLPLIYNETVNSQGITAYRFVLPLDVFAYSEEKTRNQRPQKENSQKSSFNGNAQFNSRRNPLPFYVNSQEEAEEFPSDSWKEYYGGDNKCFCYDRKCLPDGLLDMKPCLFGAPVAFSFPHFLNADPVLLHMARGLR